jgi:hypothetical protein
MTWQYRVMRRHWVGVDFSYGIYEYYKSIGKTGPGWTKGPMEPHGDTLEELRSDYAYMAEAFKHPVLDYKTGKPIKEGA